MIDAPDTGQAGIPLSAAPSPDGVRHAAGGRPTVAAPDGWEANHAVLGHLAEHRVRWRP
ncbi:hypothetical protein [Streptomyces acidiscabies]|uniref:hypothetical protein n=1 Tax=Streptomyces acidiscabies TaxID=42234 RepID=UPI0038F6F2B0